MFKRLIQLWHVMTISFVTIIMSSFLFYLGVDPLDAGRFFGAKAGQALNITSSASVPENPFNAVALQLKEKEISLNEREQGLDALEDRLVAETGSVKVWLTFIIPLVVALFILVMMNFYFDYKERKLLEKIEEDEKMIMEAEKRLEKKIDAR